MLIDGNARRGNRSCLEIGQIGDARRRIVIHASRYAAILRVDGADGDETEIGLLACQTANRRLAPLEPWCASETKLIQRHLTERGVRDTCSRDHRNTQGARATQQRGIQRIVGCAEWHAHEDPAHWGARNSLATRNRPLDALSDAIELPFVGKIHYEPSYLLLLALGAVEIEHVVAVEIFLVQAAIAHGAIRARIAHLIERAIPVSADREFRNDSRCGKLPWYRVSDHYCAVRDISGQSRVVRVCVERTRKRIAFAIEPVESGKAAP